ncbi:MAG: hypothetical protein K2J54_00905 [Clostridia bacterium]|nr:hypothetical protein [Clostridia bacterium]
MTIPNLFDEVYTNLVDFWCKKIEKSDEMGYLERENEVKAQLYEKLDDNTKETVKHYYITVENRMEHFYYEICRHLFFFSIKAGMDMQKAFDSER